jgi:hypothetical protein
MFSVCNFYFSISNKLEVLNKEPYHVLNKEPYHVRQAKFQTFQKDYLTSC